MQRRLRAIIQSEHLILLLSIALAAFGVVAVPGFVSWWNLQTLLVYLLPLLPAAIGLTFVLITGGIDLSLTSIMALVSVTGALIMSQTSGYLAGSAAAVPAGLLAMLVMGMLVGGLNGLFVTIGAIPPFIATLTTMILGSGTAIWLTRSEKIGSLPGVYLDAGQSYVLGAILVAALLLLAHLILTRSQWGQWLQAIGLNPKAAVIAGVPLRRTLFFTYLASGGLAAVSAILLSARLETGDPVLGRGYLLDIIGATVLGGTSLQGGRGKVIWTASGLLFFALLDNILNLLNVHHYYVTMSKGGAIIIASLLDFARRRRTA
jgi:ribose/xylose/arabinose/galactoside ABC-type transport system permease subunit